jgi:hypothetical protein
LSDLTDGDVKKSARRSLLTLLAVSVLKNHKNISLTDGVSAPSKLPRKKTSVKMSPACFPEHIDNFSIFRMLSVALVMVPIGIVIVSGVSSIRYRIMRGAQSFKKM